MKGGDRRMRKSVVVVVRRENEGREGVALVVVVAVRVVRTVF